MSAPAASPTTSLDRDVARVHNLVLRRAPDAAEAAVALQARVHVVEQRAELLAALAELADDRGDDGRARVAAALAACAEHEPSDTAEVLERAVGQLVTDDIDGALRLLTSAAGDRLAPADLARTRTWLEYVFRRQRSAWGQRALQAALDVAAGRKGTGLDVAGLIDQALRWTRSRRSQALQQVAPERGRAEVLMSLGQDVPALEALDGVLRVVDDGEARALRAAVLERLGRPGEALAELDRLPADVARRPEALARRIRLLTVLRRPQEAVVVGTGSVTAGDAPVELRAAFAHALGAAGDLDGARAQLLLLGDSSAPDAVAAALEGDLLIRTGQAARAVAVLEPVVQADPEDAEARVALARALAATDRPLAAAEQLATVLEAHPARVDVGLERARLLLAAGQSYKALGVLDRLHQQGVSTYETAALRASAYRDLRRADESADWYARALEQLPPEDVEAGRAYARSLEGLAEELLAQDRFEHALAALDPALQAGLLSSSGLVLRVELLRLTRRYAEALAQAEQVPAEVREADLRVAGTHAQVLVELSRSSEALEVLRPVLDAQLDYPFARSVQVTALDELGESAAALRALDDGFTAAGPDWEPWAHAARAQLLVHLGEAERAAVGLRALQEPDHDRSLRGVLGVVLLRLGNADEAVAQLRDAGVSSSSSYEVGTWPLLELADALVRSQGRAVDEASRLYRLVVARSDEEDQTPRALARTAWAMFRLGRDEEAVQLYRQALRRATDPLFDQWSRLVVVLQVLGDDAQAAQELDRLAAAAEQLSDRRRRLGVLQETAFVCDLVRAAPERAGPGLDALSARVDQLLGRTDGVLTPTSAP